jgi:hypothetical protein
MNYVEIRFSGAISLFPHWLNRAKDNHCVEIRFPVVNSLFPHSLHSKLTPPLFCDPVRGVILY